MIGEPSAVGCLKALDSPKFQKRKEKNNDETQL